VQNLDTGAERIAARIGVTPQAVMAAVEDVTAKEEVRKPISNMTGKELRDYYESICAAAGISVDPAPSTDTGSSSTKE
jgi:hypothetical protein